MVIAEIFGTNANPLKYESSHCKTIILYRTAQMCLVEIMLCDKTVKPWGVAETGETMQKKKIGVEQKFLGMLAKKGLMFLDFMSSSASGT